MINTGKTADQKIREDYLKYYALDWCCLDTLSMDSYILFNSSFYFVIYKLFENKIP